MVFSSPIFLFAFLPVVLLCYGLAPRRARNPVALAASLFFYAWGAPGFVFIVLASCLIDWKLADVMHRHPSEPLRKQIVTLTVAGNLLLLSYFKYAGFVTGSMSSLMGWLGLPAPAVLEVALPIGISFIVFEKITYVVDVYRREVVPSDSFRDYALYVFFFPQLIAGPIIKYHDVAEQLRRREHGRERIARGTSRFCLGLAKKVLVADTLGEVVDQSFGRAPESLAQLDAWLGLLCYAMQIYFDFSGYSDMAIGLALIMGFRFHENFDAPYTAQSFTEFWRRWHISLSTWIRSYLYIPLGGSRGTTIRTYVNLCVCFLLSGLWHGASWNFVVWGAYHGAFLVMDRLFLLRLQEQLPRALNVATTFVLVSIGWVVFRADDLPRALSYLAALAPHEVTRPDVFQLTNDQRLLLLLALVFSFLPATRAFDGFRRSFTEHPRQLQWMTGGASCLLLLSAAKLTMGGFRPFLYFRF